MVFALKAEVSSLINTAHPPPPQPTTQPNNQSTTQSISQSITPPPRPKCIVTRGKSEQTEKEVTRAGLEPAIVGVDTPLAIPGPVNE